MTVGAFDVGVANSVLADQPNRRRIKHITPQTETRPKPTASPISSGTRDAAQKMPARTATKTDGNQIRNLFRSISQFARRLGVVGFVSLMITFGA